MYFRYMLQKWKLVLYCVREIVVKCGKILPHTHTPHAQSKKGICCETFSWMKDTAEYSWKFAWLNKPYWNNQGSAEELQKGKSEARVPLWENTWKVKDKDIGGPESPPPDIPKIGVRVQDGLWAKGQSASAVVNDDSSYTARDNYD